MSLPVDKLRGLCEQLTGSGDMLHQTFPELLDQQDQLAKYRDEFQIPIVGDLPYETDPVLADRAAIYLLGHSLGLKPKKAEEAARMLLDCWGRYGCEGHFSGDMPFTDSDQAGKGDIAAIVGAADVKEVTVMNSLTVNLQLLLMAFYKPHGNRNKILIEDHAFPSDRYCIRSLLRFYNIQEGLLVMKPREGEQVLRDQDIITRIEEEGESIALVMLSGVQYYTGQKFDMGRITAAGKKQGCNVGWDLAHGVGNVRLELNRWGADFAVWCTYKYLNSGPGGVGGAFVHAAHHQSMPNHIDGWWGNSWDTLFEMRENIDYAIGADSLRLSCPAGLLGATHNASIKIFNEAGMDAILEKQYLLTGYLEYLLTARCSGALKIVTPSDPERRGSMLCVEVSNCDLGRVHEQLKKKGVVSDLRKPNVMRLAPVPLYNTFTDVFRFVDILQEILKDSLEN